MKLLVLFFGLLAVAFARVPLVPTYGASNYHNTIGIAAANRIKQAESAVDFDGARIVGGSPSSLGAHPHLGGLVISLTNGWTSVCGSSLLTNTKAVTAAHCWSDAFSQAWQFEVVFDSLTLFSGGTRIITNNVDMHQDWNTSNFSNDIAIITLSWVGFTNNIQPISLASGSNDYVNTIATAAGYGISSDNQSGVPTSTVLNEVTLRVITNSECAGVYGSYYVYPTTICTSGEGGRNICSGDSGGPLYIGSGNSRTLIGVVSFGAFDCEGGFPSGYARITAFNSWIQARL